jgi:hypothetical protein
MDHLKNYKSKGGKREVNLYLKIKLYIMRRLFGKGPVEVVMGPLSKMLDNTAQVSARENDRAIALAHAAKIADEESILARNINTNLRKLMG